MLLAISVGLSGCYYSHVAMGQNRLLRARKPIEAVLVDPETPREIREQLLLVLQVREFAIELGLDVGKQYTSFAEWPGDRVVTTVVATRPGSVTPAGFRFPLLGQLPYKGFFDRERASREAEALRADGLNVCESGVSAYSTLGWMDDPVTEPMLRQPPGLLVEVILHELVHATVYLKDHADFNESVASFIGEEGSVRFFESSLQPERAHRRRLEIEDDRRINAELLRFREEVSALYASRGEGSDRDEIRQHLEERARTRIRNLPLGTRDPGELADVLRMNDACLALTGTYASELERYAELFARLDGDLVALIARLRSVEDAEDPLQALLAD
ncbi:MAG: aminopeptidase [Deltaproteobacteria bacterium]|nr:aminopeptidase [Deltaproteobacteria bacterium]